MRSLRGRGLKYLFWRAAECVGRSLAATVQEGGQEGVCWVAVEPLQEPPGPMLPCEPAAPPVETFEERVVKATRSFSPEKTGVTRLCMEYGERNEICALTHRRKRQYYLHAKYLKRAMSAIRRQQNLVPKARTKKQLAELALRRQEGGDGLFGPGGGGGFHHFRGFSHPSQGMKDF